MEKARLRIDIEATGDEGEEFVIRVYAGHAQTTKADMALMVTLWEAMKELMKEPSRKVKGPNGRPMAPKTKSGKPFPKRFPFVNRRK